MPKPHVFPSCDVRQVHRAVRVQHHHPRVREEIRQEHAHHASAGARVEDGDAFSVRGGFVSVPTQPRERPLDLAPRAVRLGDFFVRGLVRQHAHERGVAVQDRVEEMFAYELGDVARRLGFLRQTATHARRRRLARHRSRLLVRARPRGARRGVSRAEIGRAGTENRPRRFVNPRRRRVGSDGDTSRSSVRRVFFVGFFFGASATKKRARHVPVLDVPAHLRVARVRAVAPRAVPTHDEAFSRGVGVGVGVGVVRETRDVAVGTATVAPQPGSDALLRSDLPECLAHATATDVVRGAYRVAQVAGRRGNRRRDGSSRTRVVCVRAVDARVARLPRLPRFEPRGVFRGRSLRRSLRLARARLPVEVLPAHQVCGDRAVQRGHAHRPP